MSAAGGPRPPARAGPVSTIAARGDRGNSQLGGSVDAGSHGVRTRRQDTASGHGVRTRRQDTASGHGVRTRRQDTASGHGVRTRRQDTASARREPVGLEAPLPREEGCRHEPWRGRDALRRRADGRREDVGRDRAVMRGSPRQCAPQRAIVACGAAHPAPRRSRNRRRNAR